MTSQLLKMDDSKSGETRIDELTSGKEIKRQLIRAMKEVSTAASQYTLAIWLIISLILYGIQYIIYLGSIWWDLSILELVNKPPFLYSRSYLELFLLHFERKNCSEKP